MKNKQSLFSNKQSFFSNKQSLFSNKQSFFSNKKNHIWYWMIPVILIIFQLIYSLNSLNQIRFEELGDSIRMPFFWHYKFLYLGASNITFYWLMNLAYGIFGFNLFLAKFVKLLLLLVSLLALASILKKYLGYKKAIIPLFAIGLSPTMIYFNMLQMSTGLDLLFLSITLYFLLNVNFERKYQSLIFQFLGFLTMMLGWLAYPAFIFYMPLLLFVYIIFLKRSKKIRKNLLIKNISISLIAFLLPLLITFFYVINNQSLIYDSHNVGSLFRGGGVLKFSSELFFNNLGYLAENLFIIGDGYYYELIQVEFSLFFPIVTILSVFYLIFRFLIFGGKKLKELKIAIVLCLIMISLNIIIVNFSDILTPGLRRYTPVLAGFYFLYTIAWWYFTKQKFDKKIRCLFICVFMLIPIHHLIAFPANLNYLKQPSLFAFYKDAIAFNYPDSPEVTLSKLVTKVQKEDLNLICVDQSKVPFECRYVEMYTVVAGSCLWNHLQCHSIKAYDFKTKEFIPLSIDLWNNHYFGP